MLLRSPSNHPAHAIYFYACNPCAEGGMVSMSDGDLICCCFQHNGILLSNILPLVFLDHFPHPSLTRCLTSTSQPPFSLIIEPIFILKYLNLFQSIFLSDVSATTLTCGVHNMTSVFFPFTFIPFLNNASCHSTTLLCNSSSVSASTPSHLHNIVVPIFFFPDTFASYYNKQESAIC